MSILVGLLLTISALAAAVGAASIGLRVSLTSDAPLQPLLGTGNDAAVDAVADAVVYEIEDAVDEPIDRPRLLAATTAVIEAGVDDGEWRTAIEQAHRETLDVSENGYGESTMDISWVVDELIRRRHADQSIRGIPSLEVISDEHAPSLKTVRDRLEWVAIYLPLAAVIAGGLGLLLTRKDRFRSLRAFALAAALTTVILGALVATVPHMVVTGRAKTDATEKLADQIVWALVRPTLIALVVLVALELTLFVVGHVGVRRRLRQAKLPEAGAS